MKLVPQIPYSAVLTPHTCNANKDFLWTITVFIKLLQDQGPDSNLITWRNPI